MAINAFLNELSCASTIDRRSANEAMTAFVELLRHIRKWRNDAALVSHVDLKSVALADGYYLPQWFAADPQNKTRWEFIRSLQNVAPPGSASFSIPDDKEYHYDSRTAEGLGRACEHEGISLSLPVDIKWDSPWIRVDCITLSGPDEVIEVRHAATVANSRVHEPWLQGPLRLPVITEGRRYYHRDFKMIVECRASGFFYSRDRDRHGGSIFKRFTIHVDGLRWDADLDEHGAVIEGKHKGPTGMFIPKGDLRSS